MLKQILFSGLLVSTTHAFSFAKVENSSYRDLARKGAEDIVYSFRNEMAHINPGSDPDDLAVTQICHYQIFTEWSETYIKVMQNTPGLKTSDLNSVTDLVQLYEDGKSFLTSTQRWMPIHLSQTRQAIVDLRRNGKFIDHPSKLNLTLDDPKQILLVTSFDDCRRSDRVLGQVNINSEPSFFSQPISFSTPVGGTVTWSTVGTGGSPVYLYTPAPSQTRPMSRLQFLRQWLLI